MTLSDVDIGRLDAGDPLRERRRLFAPLPVIYLDGNSLGPPTSGALARLRRTAEHEWAQGLIGSWNEANWIGLSRACGAKIAAVVGAQADELLVCDSVSVNLFKLAAALQRSLPDASLAIARSEFPTDIYVLEGLAAMSGAAPIGFGEGDAFPERPLILVRSLVDFRSGAVADIAATEARVCGAGGAVIWDLSHAAGVLDVGLNRNGARFAVGCGYKFLNGGPGAPAFVYVAGAEAARLSQPIRGWMGHRRPFDFAERYEPADGVARFAAGTPPILSLCALDAALDAFAGLDMGVVEAKARGLGDLFLERATALGLATVSPPGARRGGQVSLVHTEGYAVMQALIARGVVGDFRPPNLMRFGFSPLFLSWRNVADAAAILGDVLQTEEWRAPRFRERRLVV